MPPGRSDTVAMKRIRRLSAASPRSMTRPSMVMSGEEGGRERGREGGREEEGA